LAWSHFAGQPDAFEFFWQYALTLIPWEQARHVAIKAVQHGLFGGAFVTRGVDFATEALVTGGLVTELHGFPALSTAKHSLGQHF